MTQSTAPQSETAIRRRVRYGVPSIVIAVIAALFYAYVLWDAIGNLVQLPKLLGALTPWWLLILDVALPVVVFAVATLLGLRHRVLIRIAFFVLGAAVLGCCTVGSIAFVQTH
jgi:hypothetical protein